MKKIAAVLLLIVLSSTIFVFAEPTREEYTKNQLVDRIIDHEKILEEKYPVMGNPIHLQIPDESTDYSQIKIIDTPAEFNWKNYQNKDLTTPAKNQGQCGSCWAFAALGAIESLINIKEGYQDVDIDLSEQYLLSCLPAAGGCYGGNTASPFSFIINTSEEGNFENGVIFEECLPYEANDAIPCSNKAEHWYETLVPLSGYGELWFGPNTPNVVEMMKSKIYENGPIYVLFLVDNSFRNFGSIFHKSTDYYPYRSVNSEMLNHAVIIVGWKDDLSLGKGGYWICKNSWDTNWGYDGFFNIEYGSMNIQRYIAWPEYNHSSFNCPPVAHLGGFYTGSLNDEIYFDGSDSLDDDNEQLRYEWEFGDGTNGEGKTITHIYPSTGIYEVILTVTDSENKSSQDWGLVFIDEDPVSIDITGGFGVTVEITNHLDFEIKDTKLNIHIDGTVQNIDDRNEYINSISSNQQYTLMLPLVGIGKGTLNIDFENINTVKHFLSIGPFIIINE